MATVEPLPLVPLTVMARNGGRRKAQAFEHGMHPFQAERSILR